MTLNALLGTKKENTQAWLADGTRIPVSVIQVDPCQVLAIKTVKQDGYRSVQLGFGKQRLKRLSKPLKGHLKKATKGKPALHSLGEGGSSRFIKEVSLPEESKISLGDFVKVSDVFSPGDLINVTGISKGKGFTGVIKRWGFAGGPRTHGQSDRERAPGSIGQGTDPGRVHKGKKMSGHHGQKRVTIKNLLVTKVDETANQLWIKGQVPGSINSLLILKKIGQSKKFKGLINNLKSQNSRPKAGQPRAEKLKATT